MTKREKATNAVIEVAADLDLDLSDQDAATLVSEAFGVAKIAEDKRVVFNQPDAETVQLGRERLARMFALRKELDQEYACGTH